MTSHSNTLELQVTGVRFFSQGDEEAFFEWLNKLCCIKKCVGHGLTLYISINSSLVDEKGLRELLAIFHRYEIDMSQLIQFDREEFSVWFRNVDAFWCQDIFCR